jgi:hypothetical protein
MQLGFDPNDPDVAALMRRASRNVANCPGQLGTCAEAPATPALA